MCMYNMLSRHFTLGLGAHCVGPARAALGRGALHVRAALPLAARLAGWQHQQAAARAGRGHVGTWREYSPKVTDPVFFVTFTIYTSLASLHLLAAG